MKNKKVLIVGAGPTGLTAALMLARHGIIPHVIDKAKEMNNRSKAVSLFPKTLKLMPPELALQFFDKAFPIKGLHLYKNNKSVLDLDFKKSSFDQLYGYPQDQTEKILRGDFENHGGVIDYGIKLESLTQKKDKVYVDIGSTEAVYDYVIGADGVHSKVREAVGQQQKGFTLDQKWSIADIHSRDLDSRLSFWILEEGDFVGYVPIGPDRYRLFSSKNNALKALPIKINITKVNIQSTFNVGVRRVDNFQVKNVFLAGDAAHIHTPLGGRGMNLAMQDAFELAQRFIKGDLKGYNDSRQKAAKMTADFTERMRYLISSMNPLIQGLFISSVKTINCMPFLKKWLVHEFMKI